LTLETFHADYNCHDLKTEARTLDVNAGTP